MAEPLLSTSILTSWFTPASLFLLLNLVIGTIIVISHFNAGNRAPLHEETRQPLTRAPSFIDRVRSINLSLYKFSPHDVVHHNLPQLERAFSLLERVKSIKLSSFYRSEPEGSAPPAESDAGEASGMEVEHEHHHVRRSKSESRVGPVKATGYNIFKEVK